ncbi:MAG TPA: NUDIX hydrolase [Mycobacteriales bacterium]|nr:NUDIX hydrolase [Mycobacteriales bacterium]
MADVVRAAGGVLWRAARTGTGVEVAVVHRPKYDDWSLPKGKLDDGEVEVLAACREVEEETGFTGIVGRFLGTGRYTVTKAGRQVPKSVAWWSIRCTGGGFTPTAEVDELRWLRPDDVPALLSRPAEALPLERFTSGPPGTRTLLLLRHGSAGQREHWDGDDDARPLDDAGRAQAEAAAAVLPRYGVQRVLAAPLERCTASVQPLAEHLGVAVKQDVAFGAAGWAASPSTTLQRLSALVADGRTAVVCSQGEVLPAAVAELARRGGLDLPDTPEAAKGSLWALSFDEHGRTVDAHYTASLLA